MEIPYLNKMSVSNTCSTWLLVSALIYWEYSSLLSHLSTDLRTYKIEDICISFPIIMCPASKPAEFFCPPTKNTCQELKIPFTLWRWLYLLCRWFDNPCVLVMIMCSGKTSVRERYGSLSPDVALRLLQEWKMTLLGFGLIYQILSITFSSCTF